MHIYVKIWGLAMILFVGLPYAVIAQPHIPGELIVMFEQQEAPSLVLSRGNFTNNSLRLIHKKSLSKRMNIHLLTFDEDKFDAEVVLREVRNLPGVQLAQFNHYVFSRNTNLLQPNDPQYPLQWNLENTGSGGALVDADIDATDAWDITTGGVTGLGDTIVVAVIDEGIFLEHEDLILWRNHGEIPANGIDDDGNGYIDDYDGWNAYNSTGNLPSSVHGTHVAGIVSAQGNNNQGIVGVNWETQVMSIAGSSSNEAIVVEAYGYVLEMRTLYNETNGEEGAFIVAANSSFGIDQANPSNFPIWCAMYDTLGMAGIVSTVATMNTPQNVDAVGDVPSACPSDWMIAVTSTTNMDQKKGDAAFGMVNIDLGAPGADIFSTYPNDSYGYDNGTSMAAPHVAGTIALMVAAACPGFLIQYKNDPGAAALLLKESLLQGVDDLASLQSLVATGGRLNAFNAINELLDACDSLNSDCLPPYDLAVDEAQMTDTSAFLFWNQQGTASSFLIRYREVGSTIWINGISSSDTSFTLSGLAPCTNYEYQVETTCDTSSSGFFATLSFRTEGCCEYPSGLFLNNATDTTLTFSWEGEYDALGYLLQYREKGTISWFNAATMGNDTSVALMGLIPCTKYEVQISTECDTGFSEFSPIQQYPTKGCGPCLDITYCPSEGKTVQFEWIESVSLGPIFNISGANDGYGNFTTYTHQLVIDSLYSFTLTPGYQGISFSEAWRIWIDLNQDGVLDSSEIVFDSGMGTKNPINASLTIPLGTLEGNTRMRISMKYSGFNGNEVPGPCEEFDEGEVEDYCVTLTNSTATLCQTPTNLIVQPIAETDSLAISWSDPAGVNLYEISVIHLSNGNQELFQSTETSITLGGFGNCKEFEIRVRTLCDPLASSFSSLVKTRTKGCGSCLDFDYCSVSGQGNETWIAGMQFADVSNTSLSGNGFESFTQFSIELGRGFTHEYKLTPGFTDAPSDQYWQVWADWDQDGEFSETNGELIIANETATADTLSGMVQIPLTASLGSTRLRVIMRSDAGTTACDSFASGEVEDYCLQIGPASSVDPDLSILTVKIFPNPVTNQLQIESEEIIETITVIDMLGKRIFQSFGRSKSAEILVKDWPSGIYYVVVDAEKGRVVKKILKE